MRRSTYREVLQELIQTEGKVAAFYERLADLFRDRAYIGSFWKSMAADEKQHMDLLEKIADNLTPDAFNETVDADLQKKTVAMRRFVEQDALETPENLEEAFRLAEKCEQQEVVPLILLASKNAVPDTLRDDLLDKQIEVHTRRLSEFARLTGGPEERKAIRPQR